MQRRKPFEAQINQKEISIEKKVITKKIQNTYSEQKSPILSSYPPIPKTTAINLMGGQKFKETTKITNFKNYEIKDIPQERKHRNHKVYLSSRYNNMKQEETPNLLEQVSMNEEINDFNLQSIKGKKSPVQNGETLFSKELKNPNIKFNIKVITPQIRVSTKKIFELFDESLIIDHKKNITNIWDYLAYRNRKEDFSKVGEGARKKPKYYND